MPPLALTDEELNSLTAMAAALPPPLRDSLLRQVAANVDVSTHHKIGSFGTMSSDDPIAHYKGIGPDGKEGKAMVEPVCAFDGTEIGRPVDCGDEASWKAKIAPYLR
jgi:hypothetical protein